jgi:hypothetical protein
VLINFLKTLWQLVLLKRSPADLIPSYALFALVMVLVFASQWLAKEQSLPNTSSPLWFYLIVILGLLRALPFVLFQKQERMLQSLTGLFGADFLINMPLLMALHLVDATQPSLILIVLFYFAHTWRFVVSTFIYKIALDIQWIAAFGVQLAISLVNIIAVMLVSRGLTQP